MNPSTPGQRVGIYLRVSTLNQETENQLLQLRVLCEQQEWRIVREYIDVESGRKGNLDLGVLQASEMGSATFAVTVDNPLNEDETEIRNLAAIADQPVLEEGGKPDAFAEETTPIVREDTCDDVVVVPDNSLEQAIRDALEKPEGDLTCDNLASLMSLSYFGLSSGKPVSDLEGLQYAVNLQSLSLPVNQISDLSPLAKLTGLQSLNLNNNQVSNIGALVDNVGVGDRDDSINLCYNKLDFITGSQAQQDVTTLETRNPKQQNIYASDDQCNP